MLPRLVLAVLGAAALTGAAHASGGWTNCRVQNGVLVAPAKVAGLSGVFILDTGTARSVLDATQATLAGIDADHATTSLTLAGLHYANLPLTVAPLDERTHTQPTPITGVLGADVLAALTLEVRQSPCRFRLTERPEPRWPTSILPVRVKDGVPYVEAAISDGATSWSGLFRVSTGVEIGLRMPLSPARIKGASETQKIAAIRALSVGGLLIEDPLVELVDQNEPGTDGEIGEPIWARRGFQLDFAHKRLILFGSEKQNIENEIITLSQDNFRF